MTKKHNLIKTRIRARKLALSYFYWRIFVLRTSQNDAMLEDIIQSSRGLEDVHDKSKDDISGEQKELTLQLEGSFGASADIDVEYIAHYCFDKWSLDTIDMDYVLMLARGFNKYYPLMDKLIDTHTTTFSFAQMDPIDQALFVLAYEEHKLIQTPKKIIINEIVELAKRYGDSGSPKLLHGIVHHLLNDTL